ncbi:MAG: DegT/DnrJ/EryC1/StrS aminotransferase family protein [Acidobacteria bacterium]|nr:DegT/DnrJ/EryC1/StrS aminotransferase family protein [Acidobacteriota bacterium]
MLNAPYLPFNLPEIGEEEITAVVETMRSGWLTTGARTATFESDFQRYTGARHALALNSCTAALHLALEALGVGPGDEVITTPLTFCSTVHAIVHTGASPVLADVDETGNVDPASVAERITPRTKALLPVHLAGLPCRMDELWELARRHKLFVVEDAAHAVGTYYGGQHLGADGASESDAVAYSFYATKNLTTGEGGMVTTNQPELFARMKALALHGLNRDAWNRYGEKGSWFYQVLEAGFKYNLSDLQSAIGVEQLKKIERFTERRRALAERYQRAFAAVAEVECPPEAVGGRHAWHLYILRLRRERLQIGRDEFLAELRDRGIGISVHFIPVPLHPVYAALGDAYPCPRAIGLYERMFSLPLYPSMTEGQVDRVIAAVQDIADRWRR